MRRFLFGILVCLIAFTASKTVQMEQAKAETLRYCTEMMQLMFPDQQAYANSLLGYLVEKKRLKAFSDAWNG